VSFSLFLLGAFAICRYHNEQSLISPAAELRASASPFSWAERRLLSRIVRHLAEYEYSGCPRSRAQRRIKSMAGRRTKYRRRPLGPQAPSARPGENIETGGVKIGVKSGAQKSERTRAKRRSAGVR